MMLLALTNAMTMFSFRQRNWLCEQKPYAYHSFFLHSFLFCFDADFQYGIPVLIRVKYIDISKPEESDAKLCTVNFLICIPKLSILTALKLISKISLKSLVIRWFLIGFPFGLCVFAMPNWLTVSLHWSYNFVRRQHNINCSTITDYVVASISIMRQHGVFNNFQWTRPVQSLSQKIIAPFLI